MTKDMVLLLDLLPYRGAVFRIRRGTSKRFAVYWQFQARPHHIEADELIDAIKEALTALNAQYRQEGLL